MSEEKSMSKIIFTVFIVILLAFLFFHFYKVTSIEKQYKATVKTISAQLEQANKEIGTLKTEIEMLRYKLEISSIINDVAKNNFGIAQEKVDALVSKLEKNGQKNIEEIKKLQEELHNLFLKKDNNKIIEKLGILQKTIEK